MKKFIYLAGPIAGCNKGEANDWRDYVKSKFSPGIIGISPLRCEPLIKERYDDAKEFTDEKRQYKDKRFGTAQAINSKNWLDTNSCDLICAYLPREMTERRPSYGTTWELAWARALNKPAILVTDDPNIANHPLFSENVNWLFDNLDDAIDAINGLFADYVDTEPLPFALFETGEVIE